MSALVGLYRATTSPCPNQGCHKLVPHDVEESPQPCGDGRWLEMGLRDLLAERAAALTSAEIQEIFEACLDDGERAFEHPVSVALHDLSQRYRDDAAKLKDLGRTEAANVLASVPEDLEVIRVMFDQPRPGIVQAPGAPNVLDQFDALKQSLQPSGTVA